MGVKGTPLYQDFPFRLVQSDDGLKEVNKG